VLADKVSVAFLAPFFRVDALSIGFVALIVVVALATLLISFTALSGKSFNKPSYWLSSALIIVASLSAVLAANALVVLVSWLAMLLALSFLPAASTDKSVWRSVGLTCGGTIGAGVVLLAGGFVWLQAIFHSWILVDWHVLNAVCFWPALMVFIGLSINVAVCPFHSWLISMQKMLAVPESLLINCVIALAPFYLLVRLIVTAGGGSNFFAVVALLAGLSSIIFAVMRAGKEDDLKQVIAILGLQGSGVMFVAVAACLYSAANGLMVAQLATASAAIFYCLSLGLTKALLIICCGNIEVSAKSTSIKYLRERLRGMPKLAIWSFIGGFAICSLPPFCLFFGQWFFYQGIWQIVAHAQERSLAFVAVLALALVTYSLVLGSVLMAKTLVEIFGGSGERASGDGREPGVGSIFAMSVIAGCNLALVAFAANILFAFGEFVATSTSNSIWVAKFGSLVGLRMDDIFLWIFIVLATRFFLVLARGGQASAKPSSWFMAEPAMVLTLLSLAVVARNTGLGDMFSFEIGRLRFEGLLLFVAGCAFYLLAFYECTNWTLVKETLAHRWTNRSELLFLLISAFRFLIFAVLAGQCFLHSMVGPMALSKPTVLVVEVITNFALLAGLLSVEWLRRKRNWFFADRALEYAFAMALFAVALSVTRQVCSCS
jgi:formate hydrogenlyase subunit 3/multisubunit Na+/H+ antiporter MnhD subunit